jgi:hypothetical protein
MRARPNHFLETDLEKLKAAASTGYARGRLIAEAKALPRDRKDNSRFHALECPFRVQAV